MTIPLRDPRLSELENECSRFEGELTSARSTISEQEKRIAELEAERDGILDQFSKDYHAAYGCDPNMMAQGRANWRARAEAAEQALTSERQRREELEAIARPLAQGWHSYGNAEEGKLELLRGTLGIWHFKEAAEHFP